MPTQEEIAQRIRDALPGASVEVTDLTGGGDHFRAEVASDDFRGLSRIEQHRRVYDIFGQEIGDFITKAIDENRVMLFMKGRPDQPACGFSAQTAAILGAMNVQYAAMD